MNEHGSPQSWPPAGTGRWLGLTLLTAGAILAVKLYPFDFIAGGAGPMLALRHTGGLAALGEIAILVPLGLTEAALARRLFGRASGLILLAITVDALLLGLVGETAQHWLPTRTSSIIDVVANTLGGGLGCMMGEHFNRRRRGPGVPR